MKHIKEWFSYYFDGVQKPLIWILIIDFAVLIILDLFGRPLFEDSGTYIYRLVTFVYTLGLSYIASFIFYYVQVHLKEIKDRKRVLPSVEKLFQRLLTFEKEIILDTIRFANPDSEKIPFENITEEDYLSATEKIFFDEKSLVYQGARELTWLEYYTYRKAQVEDQVRLLLDYSQYLGEEGISLLADTRNDVLLSTLVTSANSLKETGQGYGFKLGSVQVFCKSFFCLVNRTNDFYTKELIPYRVPNDAIVQSIFIGKHKQIVI